MEESQPRKLTVLEQAQQTLELADRATKGDYEIPTVVVM